MSERVAIVTALEALEAGDVRYAIDVLRGAVREFKKSGPRRYVCKRCGTKFNWPGELDHHLQVSSCSLELRSRRVA